MSATQTSAAHSQVPGSDGIHFAATSTAPTFSLVLLLLRRSTLERRAADDDRNYPPAMTEDVSQVQHFDDATGYPQ